MIVREVLPEEKKQFNQMAAHPLQSWEWGEFRKLTGKKVIRLGVFDPSVKKAEEKLKAVFQLTVHPIPDTRYSILYFPRGPMPDETMLDALRKLGQEESAIFVKMAPNVSLKVNENYDNSAHQKIHDFLIKNGCRKTKPFFFEYSFQIDLSKTEEELLSAMHPKTRYNLRLSQRYGVKVVEDNSDQAFKAYLDLLMETTKRQRFYAHTPDYHRKLWKTLRPAGMAHLMLARYREKTLAAWMFLAFNKTLHYPYGASSREYHEVMPAYSMMWEAIKFGKKLDCRIFDLWGCLGPNPDPKDPWFGFHRFKTGFGGQMVQFLGTYDLTVDHRLYSVYNLIDSARWQFLKLRARLPF